MSSSHWFPPYKIRPKSENQYPFGHSFRPGKGLHSPIGGWVGFWNRNLMNMYAITKDDITFDINDDAKINTSVAKVWNQVHVSRKHARDKTWKDANQILDSNWKLDEDNLFLAVSYKKVEVSIDEINVEVKGIFTGKPDGKVSAKLKFESKQDLLFSFSFDKCATLALYKTASPAGLEQGKRIERFSDKFEFTFDVEWYR